MEKLLDKDGSAKIARQSDQRNNNAGKLRSVEPTQKSEMSLDKTSPTTKKSGSSTCDYELLDELVNRINASDEFDSSDESMPKLQNSSIEELNLFQKEKLFNKADELLLTTFSSFEEDTETPDPNIHHFIDSGPEIEPDEESEGVYERAKAIVEEQNEVTEMDKNAMQLFEQADELLKNQDNPACENFQTVNGNSTVVETVSKTVLETLSPANLLLSARSETKQQTSATTTSSSTIKNTITSTLLTTDAEVKRTESKSALETKKPSFKENEKCEFCPNDDDYDTKKSTKKSGVERSNREVNYSDLNNYPKHSKNFFRRRRKAEITRSTKMWEKFNWGIPRRSRRTTAATESNKERPTQSLKDTSSFKSESISENISAKESETTVPEPIRTDLDEKFLEGIAVLEKTGDNETECELCENEDYSTDLTEQIISDFQPTTNFRTQKKVEETTEFDSKSQVASPRTGPGSINTIKTLKSREKLREKEKLTSVIGPYTDLDQGEHTSETSLWTNEAKAAEILSSEKVTTFQAEEGESAIFDTANLKTLTSVKSELKNLSTIKSLKSREKLRERVELTSPAAAISTQEESKSSAKTSIWTDGEASTVTIIEQTEEEETVTPEKTNESSIQAEAGETAEFEKVTFEKTKPENLSTIKSLKSREKLGQREKLTSSAESDIDFTHEKTTQSAQTSLWTDKAQETSIVTANKEKDDEEILTSKKTTEFRNQAEVEESTEYDTATTEEVTSAKIELKKVDELTLSTKPTSDLTRNESEYTSETSFWTNNVQETPIVTTSEEQEKAKLFTPKKTNEWRLSHVKFSSKTHLNEKNTLATSENPESIEISSDFLETDSSEWFTVELEKSSIHLDNGTLKLGSNLELHLSDTENSSLEFPMQETSSEWYTVLLETSAGQSQENYTQEPIYTRVVIANKEYDDDENIISVKENSIISTANKSSEGEKQEDIETEYKEYEESSKIGSSVEIGQELQTESHVIQEMKSSFSQESITELLTNTKILESETLASTEAHPKSSNKKGSMETLLNTLIGGSDITLEPKPDSTNQVGLTEIGKQNNQTDIFWSEESISNSQIDLNTKMGSTTVEYNETQTTVLESSTASNDLEHLLNTSTEFSEYSSEKETALKTQQESTTHFYISTKNVITVPEVEETDIFEASSEINKEEEGIEISSKSVSSTIEPVNTSEQSSPEQLTDKFMTVENSLRQKNKQSERHYFISTAVVTIPEIEQSGSLPDSNILSEQFSKSSDTVFGLTSVESTLEYTSSQQSDTARREEEEFTSESTEQENFSIKTSLLEQVTSEISESEEDIVSEESATQEAEFSSNNAKEKHTDIVMQSETKTRSMPTGKRIWLTLESSVFEEPITESSKTIPETRLDEKNTTTSDNQASIEEESEEYKTTSSKSESLIGEESNKLTSEYLASESEEPEHIDEEFSVREFEAHGTTLEPETVQEPASEERESESAIQESTHEEQEPESILNNTTQGGFSTESSLSMNEEEESRMSTITHEQTEEEMKSEVSQTIFNSKEVQAKEGFTTENSVEDTTTELSFLGKYESIITESTPKLKTGEESVEALESWEQDHFSKESSFMQEVSETITKATLSSKQKIDVGEAILTKSTIIDQEQKRSTLKPRPSEETEIEILKATTEENMKSEDTTVESEEEEISSTEPYTEVESQRVEYQESLLTNAHATTREEYVLKSSSSEEFTTKYGLHKKNKLKIISTSLRSEENTESEENRQLATEKENNRSELPTKRGQQTTLFIEPSEITEISEQISEDEDQMAITRISQFTVKESEKYSSFEETENQATKSTSMSKPKIETEYPTTVSQEEYEETELILKSTERGSISSSVEVAEAEEDEEDSKLKSSREEIGTEKAGRENLESTLESMEQQSSSIESSALGETKPTFQTNEMKMENTMLTQEEVTEGDFTMKSNEPSLPRKTNEPILVSKQEEELEVANELHHTMEGVEQESASTEYRLFENTESVAAELSEKVSQFTAVQVTRAQIRESTETGSVSNLLEETEPEKIEHQQVGSTTEKREQQKFSIESSLFTKTVAEETNLSSETNLIEIDRTMLIHGEVTRTELIGESSELNLSTQTETYSSEAFDTEETGHEETKFLISTEKEKLSSSAKETERGKTKLENPKYTLENEAKESSLIKSSSLSETERTTSEATFKSEIETQEEATHAEFTVESNEQSSLSIEPSLPTEKGDAAMLEKGLEVSEKAQHTVKNLEQGSFSTKYNSVEEDELAITKTLHTSKIDKDAMLNISEDILKSTVRESISSSLKATGTEKADHEEPDYTMEIKEQHRLTLKSSLLTRIETETTEPPIQTNELETNTMLTYRETKQTEFLMETNEQAKGTMLRTIQEKPEQERFTEESYSFKSSSFEEARIDIPKSSPLPEQETESQDYRTTEQESYSSSLEETEMATKKEIFTTGDLEYKETIITNAHKATKNVLTPETTQQERFSTEIQLENKETSTLTEVETVEYEKTMLTTQEISETEFVTESTETESSVKSLKGLEIEHPETLLKSEDNLERQRQEKFSTESVPLEKNETEIPQSTLKSQANTELGNSVLLSTHEETVESKEESFSRQFGLSEVIFKSTSQMNQFEETDLIKSRRTSERVELEDTTKSRYTSKEVDIEATNGEEPVKPSTEQEGLSLESNYVTEAETDVSRTRHEPVQKVESEETTFEAGQDKEAKVTAIDEKRKSTTKSEGQEHTHTPATTDVAEFTMDEAKQEGFSIKSSSLEEIGETEMESRNKETSIKSSLLEETITEATHPSFSLEETVEKEEMEYTIKDSLSTKFNSFEVSKIDNQQPTVVNKEIGSRITTVKGTSAQESTVFNFENTEKFMSLQKFGTEITGTSYESVANDESKQSSKENRITSFAKVEQYSSDESISEISASTRESTEIGKERYFTIPSLSKNTLAGLTTTEIEDEYMLSVKHGESEEVKFNTSQQQIEIGLSTSIVTSKNEEEVEATAQMSTDMQWKEVESTLESTDHKNFSAEPSGVTEMEPSGTYVEIEPYRSSKNDRTIGEELESDESREPPLQSTESQAEQSKVPTTTKGEEMQGLENVTRARDKSLKIDGNHYLIEDQDLLCDWCSRNTTSDILEHSTDATHASLEDENKKKLSTEDRNFKTTDNSKQTTVSLEETADQTAAPQEKEVGSQPMETSTGLEERVHKEKSYYIKENSERGTNEEVTEISDEPGKFDVSRTHESNENEASTSKMVSEYNKMPSEESASYSVQSTEWKEEEQRMEEIIVTKSEEIIKSIYQDKESRKITNESVIFSNNQTEEQRKTQPSASVENITQAISKSVELEEPELTQAIVGTVPKDLKEITEGINQNSSLETTLPPHNRRFQIVTYFPPPKHTHVDKDLFTLTEKFEFRLPKKETTKANKAIDIVDVTLHRDETEVIDTDEESNETSSPENETNFTEGSSEHKTQTQISSLEDSTAPYEYQHIEENPEGKIQTQTLKSGELSTRKQYETDFLTSLEEEEQKFTEYSQKYEKELQHTQRTIHKMSEEPNGDFLEIGETTPCKFCTGNHKIHDDHTHSSIQNKFKEKYMHSTHENHHKPSQPREEPDQKDFIDFTEKDKKTPCEFCTGKSLEPDHHEKQHSPYKSHVAKEHGKYTKTEETLMAHKPTKTIEEINMDKHPLQVTLETESSEATTEKEDHMPTDSHLSEHENHRDTEESETSEKHQLTETMEEHKETHDQALEEKKETESSEVVSEKESLSSTKAINVKELSELDAVTEPESSFKNITREATIRITETTIYKHGGAVSESSTDMEPEEHLTYVLPGEIESKVTKQVSEKVENYTTEQETSVTREVVSELSSTASYTHTEKEVEIPETTSEEENHFASSEEEGHSTEVKIEREKELKEKKLTAEMSTEGYESQTEPTTEFSETKLYQTAESTELKIEESTETKYLKETDEVSLSTHEKKSEEVSIPEIGEEYSTEIKALGETTEERPTTESVSEEHEQNVGTQPEASTKILEQNVLTEVFEEETRKSPRPEVSSEELEGRVNTELQASTEAEEGDVTKEISRKEEASSEPLEKEHISDQQETEKTEAQEDDTTDSRTHRKLEKEMETILSETREHEISQFTTEFSTTEVEENDEGISGKKVATESVPMEETHPVASELSEAEIHTTPTDLEHETESGTEMEVFTKAQETEATIESPERGENEHSKSVGGIMSTEPQEGGNDTKASKEMSAMLKSSHAGKEEELKPTEELKEGAVTASGEASVSEEENIGLKTKPEATTIEDRKDELETIIIPTEPGKETAGEATEGEKEEEISQATSSTKEEDVKQSSQSAAEEDNSTKAQEEGGEKTHPTGETNEETTEREKEGGKDTQTSRETTEKVISPSSESATELQVESGEEKYASTEALEEEVAISSKSTEEEGISTEHNEEGTAIELENQSGEETHVSAKGTEEVTQSHISTKPEQSSEEIESSKEAKENSLMTELPGIEQGEVTKSTEEEKEGVSINPEKERVSEEEEESLTTQSQETTIENETLSTGLQKQDYEKQLEEEEVGFKTTSSFGEESSQSAAEEGRSTEFEEETSKEEIEAGEKISSQFKEEKHETRVSAEPREEEITDAAKEMNVENDTEKTEQELEGSRTQESAEEQVNATEETETKETTEQQEQESSEEQEKAETVSSTTTSVMKTTENETQVPAETREEEITDAAKEMNVENNTEKTEQELEGSGTQESEEEQVNATEETEMKETTEQQEQESSEEQEKAETVSSTTISVIETTENETQVSAETREEEITDAAEEMNGENNPEKIEQDLEGSGTQESEEEQINDTEETEMQETTEQQEQESSEEQEKAETVPSTTTSVMETTENESVRNQEILTEISVFDEAVEMAKITEGATHQNASEVEENHIFENNQSTSEETTIFHHGGTELSSSTEILEDQDEKMSKSTKSVVIIVNNSGKKIDKINNTMLEKLLNKSVTDVDLEYIEFHNLSDKTTERNKSELFIGIPVEKCDEKDFEANNNCLCNIQQYLHTISEKVKNKDEIHPKTLYCYKFVRPKDGLLIQSKSKSLIRKTRSLLYLQNLENRHEVVEHENLEGLFREDYKLDISDKNIFALPGTMLEIPCRGKADKILPSANDNIWVWHSLDTKKDEILPERSNILTIHHVTTNSSGNYSCYKEEDQENPEKIHVHELEVITFPIYDVQMNIFYKINATCELTDADILYSYLPKIVSPILCSNDDDVCTVKIERPRCLNREDDTFYNVSISAKIKPDATFFNSLNNEECDINCKLMVYNNIVTLVNRNAEAIEHIPVHSDLPSSTTSDFVPHFSTKANSAVDTKPPKILVSCPGGFGLESKRQSVCVVCPKQTFSADDEAFCKTCPPGQYQPHLGSKYCNQCNSPVDDSACLRMLYSDTKLFKIYVGMAFGILIFLIIGFALWSSSGRDQPDQMKNAYFEGSLRHRALKTRKAVEHDLESGVRQPLLGSPQKREEHPPELPPVDF